MRVKCAVPPLCYDFSNVANFLARADVRKTLGVGTRKYVLLLLLLRLRLLIHAAG